MMLVTSSAEIASSGSSAVEDGRVAFSSFVGMASMSCPIRVIEIEVRYESRWSISRTFSTTCLRSAACLAHLVAVTMLQSAGRRMQTVGAS